MHPSTLAAEHRLHTVIRVPGSDHSLRPGLVSRVETELDAKHCVLLHASEAEVAPEVEVDSAERWIVHQLQQRIGRRSPVLECELGAPVHRISEYESHLSAALAVH